MRNNFEVPKNTWSSAQTCEKCMKWVSSIVNIVKTIKLCENMRKCVNMIQNVQKHAYKLEAAYTHENV